MMDSFLQKEAFVDIFAQVKDVDEQIFGFIFKTFRKEKVQDCIGYLSDNGNQKQLEQQFLQKFNLALVEMEQKLYNFRNQMKQITDGLKKIKNHDFNKKDYSDEKIYQSIRQLITIMKGKRQMIEFLLFLVHLTSIDNSLIKCGSNSLHLLVQMNVDLSQKNFENIKISKTSLVRANFFRCDLSGSEFDNVNISGINLNCAKLFHCKWQNIRVDQLHHLKGHLSQVKQVSFSPNGTTLVSCDGDTSIRIWDIKRGKTLSLFYSSRITSVCFSPNNSNLATYGDYLNIWDTKRGKILSKLNYNGQVICYSPNGTTLAFNYIKLIIIWDVERRQQKFELCGHDRYVQSVCFSPEGTTLASGGEDRMIYLWDVKTGKKKFKLRCDEGEIASLFFSPDGTILYPYVEYQNKKKNFSLKGHGNYVKSLCFSPDGTTLASGGDEVFMRLWEVKTGQIKAQLYCNNSINSICYSPDGSKLSFNGVDSSILLYDSKAIEINTLLNYYWGVFIQFFPDGKTLMSYDRSLRILDVQTGKENFNQKIKLKLQMQCAFPQMELYWHRMDPYLFKYGMLKQENQNLNQMVTLNQYVQSAFLLMVLHQHLVVTISLYVSGMQKHDRVWQVCFSPDSSSLASVCDDNYIYQWNVNTGNLKSLLKGHNNFFNTITFSPDGLMLAVVSDYSFIFLMKAKTGKCLYKFEGHDGNINQICFSPDSTQLASGGYDTSILLSDVQTGQQKSQLNGHLYCVNSICFSPDGSYLASGSWDNSICIWDVKTSQQNDQLNGHSDCVSSVCFSPNGTLLASGSFDNLIILWDVKTAIQKSKFEGHTQGVNSICFYPDSTRLASGSKDLSICLWDVKTRQLISQLFGHSSSVRSVNFSPNCNILASSSDDGSICLWDMAKGQKIQDLDKFCQEIPTKFQNPIKTFSLLNNDKFVIPYTKLLISSDPISTLIYNQDQQFISGYSQKIKSFIELNFIISIFNQYIINCQNDIIFSIDE
ncbi:unnamed protein product [Paramecium pentaurelia]|uniref:WD-40 repeat protein n=1 Tax=Paramecium pentaurelia TaxID=43138 RepID=A0A8S1VTS2_9CILI|nr:unnamed protein product [Paramecium pentaurelia]